MHKKLNIVFASHTYIGSTFVVGSHHLAKVFSKQGHKVCHISTPLTPFHIIRLKKHDVSNRFKLLLKKDLSFHGVFNLVPFTLFPWSISKLFKLNPMQSWESSIIKYQVKKYFNNEKIDLLLIDQPVLNGIEYIINPKKMVYRPTDIYSAMLNDKSILEIEKKIINGSDAVIATSKPVIDHLERYVHEKPCFIIENGVEYDHFLFKGNKNKRNKVPNLIYVGALDKRIDINFIKYIANKLQNVHISILGPYSEEVLKTFKQCSNITLHGGVSYHNVPQFLHKADLALLPLSNHKANLGRSPMKLYEYLSAGLPVVSKLTPELKRRNIPYVSLYDNYEEGLMLILKLIDESYVINKEDIAKTAIEYSWDKRAEKLLSYII
ncbi:glycosyltransferase [Metabacillus arenae]|uniref:Glycosyltransferase n=1 Tax=Metabacillus arenae TaxID=2771434 RepID=A0A926NFS8_9BACI|nr:glycosyltransferase [Metabacillus arenae]MBD1382679.1 glycosyltransferase [Metabacillus arenae]